MIYQVISCDVVYSIFETTDRVAVWARLSLQDRMTDSHSDGIWVILNPPEACQPLSLESGEIV